MLNSRRDFLKKAFMGSAILAISQNKIFAMAKESLLHLCILHTNDVHSRIESLPSNHPTFPAMGGFAKRAHIINSIREENQNVLLFDAGDIFQGTPYFNLYKGEIEFKLMSEMGYNGATLGNHEFDNGLEGLEKQLKHASFPFICSNYDFSDTILHKKTQKYLIIEKNNLKIGVIGLGIELDGLVNKSMYGNTTYLDPVESAKHYANILKNDFKCHMVICLSHLGYSYQNDKVSDVVLAKNTKNIDLIIGGHTHTNLDPAVRILNTENKEVIIAQTGYMGVRIGRLDFVFESFSKRKLASYYTTKKIKKQ